MTWSYSVTENYVTQTFIVTIDSSAIAGPDPEQNSVTFISVSRNDGNRLYFRTFEDKTYEMPPEAISVLTEQIGVIFDDGTVDDDAAVTLDLSQTSLTGLLIDLRFLSVHRRADDNRDRKDGVTENSLGSRITTIIGTDQNDFIIGSAAAETIEGRDGDDYLAGGGGDDTLEGGDGDDIITPGSGNDHIDGGGAGTDSFWLRWISGTEDKTAGDRLIEIAEAGDSTALYYDDAVTFQNLANDYGIDTSVVGAWVRMDDGTDGLTGFSFTSFETADSLQKKTFTGIENITVNTFSSWGSDKTRLYATAVIEGNDDDNVLIGGAYIDWIWGGSGDDILFGGGRDDHLFGGAGRDILIGGYGTDILDGGEGEDTLIGGSGDDTLYGGTGNDVIEGGDGDDHIYGNGGDDRLYADEGSSRIWGGSGDDIIHGSDSKDWLRGEDDNDTLYGYESNDLLYGHEGDDSLYGGDGDDNLFGDEGNDTIYGEAGNDTLRGLAGSDTLYGGAGDDDIEGDSNAVNGGNDTIYGGAGNDNLRGGQGNDRFVIDLRTGSDNGTDTIREFAKSGSSADKIVFDTDDANETSLTELGLSLIYDGSDTKIVDADDTSSEYAQVLGVDLRDGSTFSSYFEVI